MRSLFFWGLTIACLALAGCATPVTTQKNAGDVASIIGVPASQIQFAGYCGWGNVAPGGKHPEGGGEGLIALTSNSLVLLQGDLPGATVQQRINYRELNGVDAKHFIRACQLQVLYKDAVMVMIITKNKALMDQTGTDRAAQILREHGVPSFKSKHYYQPKIPPPNFIFVPI